MRNIDTYAMYLTSQHEQFLRVLSSHIISLLQITSPTNVICIKPNTFSSLILDKKSYILLASLINCSSKVLVEQNQASFANTAPKVLTGLIVAHGIVMAQLDLRYFGYLVKNLDKSQLEKTFAMICKCKSIRPDCPQAAYFLKELTDSQGFNFKVATLETLINTNNFELVFSLVNKQKDQIKFELRTNLSSKKKLWNALARSMKSGLFLEVKLWLILEFSSLTTISFVRSICEINTTFSLSRNPIKVCLLYHQVLEKFQKKFSVLKIIITNKANHVIQLCNLFIQEVDSQKQMQEILNETDLTGYPVKNLIKHHPELLLKIETVIQRDWQGYLDIVTHETFSLSALYHAAHEHNMSEIAMGSKFFSRHKHLANPIQFGIFRRSPILKYMSQLLATIAIAIFIEIISIKIVDSMHEAFDHAHSEEEGHHHEHAVEEAIANLRIFFFICAPLQMCYPLQTILDICFRKLSGRSYTILNFECFLNIGVFLSLILFLLDFNLEILKFVERDEQEAFHLLQSVRFTSYTGIYFAAFTAFVWLRVLYLLRLNRILGPLIKIIFHMTKDILKFVFLLILIILTFACIGNIEFQVPQFYTFQQSIITLYSWMLGEFSFDTMEPQGIKGIVFLAIYLLINLILLLNFVIAIISSTYSRLQNYGVGLYLQNLIDVLPKWNYSREYNVLSYRVPPLNVLSIIFLPCLLKRFRLLNIIIESIYYTPAFYFTVFCVIILDLVFFPFAWIELFYQACTRKRGCTTFLKALLFPIIILPYIFLDMFLAGLKLIARPYIQLQQDDITTNRLMLKSDLSILKTILQRDYKDEEEPIPLFELVRKVRDEIPFTCNFNDLARIAYQKKAQGASFDQDETLDQSLQYLIKKKRGTSIRRKHFLLSNYLQSTREKGSQYLDKSGRKLELNQVQRFDAIKNFLSGNSFEGSDGVFYIFPGKLLQALMQVGSMKSIQADSKQIAKIQRLNTSQTASNISKSKNESSMSIVPSEVRLSKITSTHEYEDNMFIYRMNVSRIVRKERELNLKMGITLSEIQENAIIHNRAQQSERRTYYNRLKSNFDVPSNLDSLSLNRRLN